MKKAFWLAALMAMFAMIPAKSQAHSHDSDDEGYPLRLIAYVVHPIGVALQDFVVRPIHRFVSATPKRGYWFGHEPREREIH